MSYTAEITAGTTAERFRAYAKAPMTRNPSAADHAAMAKQGKAFAKGQKVGYHVHEVHVDGPVSGSSVTIDSKGAEITHVAFYAGPVESEVVVGSVEVNAVGSIEIALVEQKDSTPEPVSEADLKG